ncbi:DUF1627 domain-containing protein, partial [Escherichia coli]
ADELATLFGTTSRKVASTLAMAISKGRLIRVNQGGKFRYCIPWLITMFSRNSQRRQNCRKKSPQQQ